MAQYTLSIAISSMLSLPSHSQSTLDHAVITAHQHSCILWTDHSLKCWGQNDYGQLGLGDTSNRGDAADEMSGNLPFVDLGDISPAVQVIAGQDHTCLITVDGELKCWGSNLNGRLGQNPQLRRISDPATIEPIDLGHDFKTTQITRGSSPCALSEDNRVKCWGSPLHSDYEMGDNLPSLDFGLNNLMITELVGDDITCALFVNQRIKCFDAEAVQSDYNLTNLSFVDLGSEFKVKQLAVGSNHICALSEDFEVKCWGNNRYGQCGYPELATCTDSDCLIAEPLEDAVDLGSDFNPTQIIAGAAHTCAMDASHRVKCWGSNFDGELGLGDDEDRGDDANEMGNKLSFLRFGDDFEPIQIAAGSGHTCALSVDNKMRCWGSNIYGELGYATNTERIIAIPRNVEDVIWYATPEPTPSPTLQPVMVKAAQSSTTVIVVSVIGSVLFVLFVIDIVVFCRYCRKKRRRRAAPPAELEMQNVVAPGADPAAAAAMDDNSGSSHKSEESEEKKEEHQVFEGGVSPQPGQHQIEMAEVDNDSDDDVVQDITVGGVGSKSNGNQQIQSNSPSSP